MKIGANTIASLKIGSTDISEVRLGSVLVWQNMDADAAAFIAAAGITDATQKSAINTLVVDLKGYGLWLKMKALYPFVGGTATTHKFNLKNPLDTNAAFRLGFAGGWTHNINGVVGNGSNSFANSYLIPSSVLTNNSISIGIYTRDDFTSSTNEMGCSNSGSSPILSLTNCTGALGGEDALMDGYDFTEHRITRSNPTSSGLTVGSITSSTSQGIYQDGVLLGSINTSAQTQSQPSISITIGARNDNGFPVNYSTKNICFAFIGDGLDATENANLYTAVQAFQTTLSRNV